MEPKMKNRYVIDGEVVRIFIKDQVCLIDLEDFGLVSKSSWYLTKGGYARTRFSGVSHLMHRLLIDHNNYQVDHINHNCLDNRKSNLRIATSSQNGANRLSGTNNTSGIKGVYWNTSENKWYAGIKFKGKHIHIGCFTDIEEAAVAYKTKATELFGEFAFTG